MCAFAGFDDAHGSGPPQLAMLRSWERLLASVPPPPQPASDSSGDVPAEEEQQQEGEGGAVQGQQGPARGGEQQHHLAPLGEEEEGPRSDGTPDMEVQVGGLSGDKEEDGDRE